MKKFPCSHSGPGTFGVIVLLVGSGLLLIPARPLGGDNLVFYLPNHRQVIALITLGQTNYLPLLPTLNLIGRVRGLKGSPDSLEVWFGETELRFRANSKKVEVNRATVTLRESVRVQEGRWLVPLDFMNAVLPRLTALPVEYRPGSRRVFIGGVKPATLNFHMAPMANGVRMVMEFSAPVSVRTASENGKWILYFGGLPVELQGQKLETPNPYLKSIQFDDQDGQPKMIITPQVEGLDFYPTLEENGKVLRAELIKLSPTEAQQAAAAQAPPAAHGGPPAVSGPPRAPESGNPPATAPSGAPLPAVVLDPGHGGENVGARGENGVLEKNLVAQVVVQVRTALLATGRYRVVLTRVGDTDPDFDQRDSTANAARPIAFLSFHAGDLGFRSPRVVVYTFQPPLPTPGLEEGGVRPLLVPWNEIQEWRIPQSRQLAQELQDQFVRVPGLLPSKPDQAPVRVLRSVDAPAVAIEMGSLTPTTDPAPLVSSEFQRQLAEAVAHAIEAFQQKGSNP